jgi:hypothetical protein
MDGEKKSRFRVLEYFKVVLISIKAKTPYQA